MIEVLRHKNQGFSILVDPAGTVPHSCIAKWPDGFAMIALGTWEVIAGDPPSAELVDYLKSNEPFLWDVVAFYLS